MPEIKEPDMEFEDSEQYKTRGDTLTIGEIALEQYRKCCREGAKEMTEGGVIRRLIGDKVLEFVVPNQIEIFINSVVMLKITLTRRFEENKDVVGKYVEAFDKDLKTLRELHNKKIKKAEEIFMKKPNEFKKIYAEEYNLFLRNEDRRCQLARVNIYKNLLIGMSVLLDYLDWFSEKGVIGSE